MIRIRRIALATLAAGSVAVACARNPVTGKSELSLVSESQEIELGRQSAQQVIQQMGLYQDEKVQQYVSRLGMQLAAKSERPHLPWEFHVMDDPTVNAFALPGGYIFITRGILTHMNNEAELVGVLGHEIGHVTARHSVQMLSRQQLAQIGLVAGSILSSDIARYAGLASQGLQLLFLKYGRDAESQSDELGFKYMVREGYDPRAMATMFETLQRVSELQGAGDIPEWASTHPDPGNRVAATLKRVDTLSVPLDKLQTDREEYLQYVRGMTYGDDPRQGYFDGNTFYHPDLRFQLQMPQGWQAQNTPASLAAISPNQDAIIQLTAPGKGTPEQAAQQFFSQQGIQSAGTSRENINGLPAVSSYFAAQTQQGTIEGIVAFINHGDLTYQFLGYTPQGGLRKYDQLLRQVIGSFKPLNDPARINVTPRKVELVKIQRAMTIEEFHRQSPSTVSVQEVAVVNGYQDPATRVAAGTTLKRIVGGTGK